MTYSPEEVADRLEINDTIVRYVHAMDDHEIDKLDTVFTPDCQFDFTSVGRPRGRWFELKTFYKNIQHSRTKGMHFFGMSLITFLNEQRSQANVRTLVINPMGAMRDGREVFFQNHGTYDDLFVRLPEGWRISERTWNHGWISGDNPYEGTTMGEARLALANAHSDSSAAPTSA